MVTASSRMHTRQRALLRAALEEGLTDRAEEIRRQALERADELWETATAALAAAGAQVHRAADAQQARELLLELTSPTDVIAKSKSNLLAELGVRGCNREFVETDIGDWVASELAIDRSHPVLPALGVSVADIADLLRERYGTDVEPIPQHLVAAIAGLIRRAILDADVGLTGANFVTSHGELILLENEGNIALVTSVPKRHIAFVGLDKIVVDAGDALALARCLAIYATGQAAPGRLHVLTGPSHTADVADEIVVGANGPLDLHVVVVDNGRSAMLRDRRLRQALHCIGCGYCLLNCPIYREVGPEFGGTYLGGIGLVKSHFLGVSTPARMLEACLGCELCEEQCPVGTKIYDNVKAVRGENPTAVARAVRDQVMAGSNAVEGFGLWD